LISVSDLTAVLPPFMLVRYTWLWGMCFLVTFGVAYNANQPPRRQMFSHEERPGNQRAVTLICDITLTHLLFRPWTHERPCGIILPVNYTLLITVGVLNKAFN